jgi:predicted dehydrogenase
MNETVAPITARPADRSASPTTRVAILGCGYVANMYRLTMSAHPELRLAGVFDRERSRCETMARLTGAQAYPSFEALLADEATPLVLNLTNPGAHYETTRALLEAGKHVYSEKPLAMRLDEARALAEIAEERGLALASAPTTLLSPVAQTVWKAIRDGAIGRIRLVYAEMDDGMVPRAPVAKWINEGGVAWPAVDEFQTGCTVEHAGYVLSWLCAFFGPVATVTAFADILDHDKIPGLALAPAPDFSVACLKFRSGVVARMTNGLYAEHDHRLALWGDEGAILVEDPRSDRSTVTLRRYRTIRRRRFLGRGRRLPLLGGRERIAAYRGSQTRDFCRAVADMAAAIAAGRAPYLGARFALHQTEVTLACHYGAHPTGAAAGFGAQPYRTTTDFPPLEPPPWAR